MHAVAQCVELELGVLRPLGQQRDGIGARGDVVRIVDQPDLLDSRHRTNYRIVRDDNGAGADQLLGDLDCRCIAQVVRARLEREAEQTDPTSAQPVEPSPQLLHDEIALPAVHVSGGTQELRVIAVVGRDRDELAHVLAEARTAPSDAGFEERRSDPTIEAEGMGNNGHVGAGELADVRDLVHEADLERQERVRRVLERLRAREAGPHELRQTLTSPTLEGLLQDRTVQIGNRLDGLGIVAAEHDAVGVQEVVDRGALAQELRIGDSRERNAVPRFGRRILDERLQPARGSDGNGALRDEHLGAIQRAPDHDRGLRQRVHLGVPVGPGRCPDAKEDKVGRTHRIDRVVGEAQPPRRELAAKSRVDAALEERCTSALQCRKLRSIDLEHHDLAPQRRETGRDDRTDVSAADDSYSTYPHCQLTSAPESEPVSHRA